MKVQLKKDYGGFIAGDIVKVKPAHNLPRRNRAIAGYWLLEGKNKNGVKWSEDAVGCLIAFNDATVIQMTAKEREFEELQDALEWLHNLLKPGDTVYTKCSHVSRSGMMRHIECYVANKTEEGGAFITNITWAVSKVAGYRINERGALLVGGCGMDMGFSVVYSLAARMYGRGEGCAAYGYVSGRNGDTHPETDGGYLLSQRWL